MSSSDGDLQAEDWQQAAVLGKPHKSRRLPISCSLWTWSHISRNIHQCWMWWTYIYKHVVVVKRSGENIVEKLGGKVDQNQRCWMQQGDKFQDEIRSPPLTFVLSVFSLVHTSIYWPSLFMRWFKIHSIFFRHPSLLSDMAMWRCWKRKIFSAGTTGTQATHSMAHALTCCVHWHATSRPTRSSFS